MHVTRVALAVLIRKRVNEEDFLLMEKSVTIPR